MIYNPFKNMLNRFLSAILSPFRTVFVFLGRVTPGVKKLGSLPYEVIVAICLFFFLAFTVVFYRLLKAGGFNAEFATQFKDWPYFVLLVIAIPVVTYFFLRVWLRPPASPFPDIEEAFEAGVQAMEKAGIDIKNVPICLVLGFNEGKQIRAIAEASGESFDLHGVTGPGQALTWYVSPNQAFIFLSGVGNLVQFVQSTPEVRTSGGMETEGQFTHTADIRDFYNVKKSYDDESEVVSKAAMGTLRAGEGPIASSATTASYEAPEPEPTPAPTTTVRAKTSEEKRRLTYFASLLRKSRDSVCPLNGMMVNADIGQIETFPEEISRKANDDLETLTQALGAVSTVTTVISGFHRDPGFVDFAEQLVEENGEGFLHNKFGKSYRSWAAPSREQLEKIAHGALEEFDHFVHLLFSKHDALAANRVLGNRRMVLFLCRLYSKVLPGLKTFLSRGLHSKTEEGTLEFPRFAGCYFIGNNDERDYFTKKIFERIEENQGEIEWTGKTINREETWNLATNLCLLTGIVSFVVFAFLFVYGRN